MFFNGQQYCSTVVADPLVYLKQIGSLYTSKPKDALQQLEAATKQLEDCPHDTLLATAYHEIGKWYYNRKIEDAKAFNLFEKAIAIRVQKLGKNDEKTIRSYTNAAIEGIRLYRFETALQYIQNAANGLDQNKTLPVSLQLIIYVNYGTILSKLGDYEQALLWFHKGQSIVEADSIPASYPYHGVTYPESYNAAGIAYMQLGKQQDAFQQYEKAIKGYRSLKQMDTAKVAMCWNNQALSLRRANNVDTAMSLLQKAIAELDIISNKNKDIILIQGNMELEIGHCWFQKNLLDKAESQYQKSIDFFNKNELFENVYYAEALWSLGDVYFKKDSFENALAEYDKAVKVLIPNQDRTKIFAPVETVEALSRQARALAALSRVEMKHRNPAKNTFLLADSLIFALNKAYTADNSKFNLIETAIPMYESALSLAIADQDTDMILYYFDRPKAVVLRESLHDRQMKTVVGVHKDTLQQEQNLQLEIAYWQKKILESENSIQKGGFQDSFFNAVRHLELLKKHLFENNPQYAALKYQTKVPSKLSDLQQNLKPNRAIIEYFVGNDSLYTLTISKQKMFIEAQLLPNQWLHSFDSFRTTFVKKPADGAAGLQSQRDFTRLSHYFYNILLKNSVAKLEASESSNDTIQSLHIIPDAWLGYMPFALLTERLETTWEATDAEQPSYLFLKYALSCNYSHDFQYNTPYKVSYFKPIRVGAYGISYEHENKVNSRASVPKGKNYEPLPNAHREIKELSQIFGNQLDTFTDAEVHANKTTKRGFLNQIQKHPYSILHLSMHADMNEENPLKSALVFSKRDTMPSEDNELTINEIAALNLNHNYLTVLSACNTAVGKWHRGEGIMSVTRAFSLAGCQSLFATFWSVTEGDAGQVAKLFYENLKAGMDKDVALQRAQKAHFKAKAPYQWAFPVIIGDMQNIDIQSNTYWYYFLLIPILLLLGWMIRR